MRLHARRGDLGAEDVAVAVEHEAGQPVSLAVAEAVEGHVEERFAQLERPREPFADEARVERLVGPAADDARRDERGRVDVGRAQGPPARLADLRGLAGRKGRQG